MDDEIHVIDGEEYLPEQKPINVWTTFNPKIQSKITLIVTSLVIFKITYDILNDVSLSITHVISLIILFFFLGYFNIDKTIVVEK